MEAGEVKQGQTPFSVTAPDWTQADLSHPVFAPVRRWLERLPRGEWPTHALLNAMAEEAGLTTLSGTGLRFVAPKPADPYYEVQVSATGKVQTRPRNWHDLFNALAWLAFPKTKARINAMHAAEIPRETGVRGRLRDMLTLFDEGGAVVACADRALEDLIRQHRWKELFWNHRAGVLTDLRIHVLGHALLEMALRPRPGLTCKVMFIEPGADPDSAAERWLAARGKTGTTRDLVSLPIFGYPGWYPDGETEAFYADERYFRPFRKAGAGQKNVVRP